MDSENKRYVFLCPLTGGDAVMLKPGSSVDLGREQFPRFGPTVSRKHVAVHSLDHRNQENLIRLSVLGSSCYIRRPDSGWKRLLGGEETELTARDHFALSRESDPKLNSTFSLRFCSLKDFNDDFNPTASSVLPIRNLDGSEMGTETPLTPGDEGKDHPHPEKISIFAAGYPDFTSTYPPIYNPPGNIPLPARHGEWRKMLLPYLKRGYRLPALSESVYFEDELCVVIYDRFPKAKYHLLVMPREHIFRLENLKPSNSDLLDGMIQRAEWIIKGLSQRDEESVFVKGFHAIPSMLQIHLHIVSTDFHSPFLKKNAHWHSFTTPFLLSPSLVLDELNERGQIRLDKKHYERFLKDERLGCTRCDGLFQSLNALKRHVGTCRGEFKADYLTTALVVATTRLNKSLSAE